MLQLRNDCANDLARCATIPPVPVFPCQGLCTTLCYKSL